MKDAPTLEISPRRPEGFRIATLISVTRPFPNFYRVTMRAPNLTRYAEGAMHFRLLLPPEGRDPVWPWLDDDGRMKFPGGADKLHNPVYTFVEIDVDKELFTFDVFIHDGGRITAWVEAAQPGDTIGMTGPGGGTMPQTTEIAMFGDETALPAIRRILAQAPADLKGSAHIEVGGTEDIQEFAKPEGVAITWLMRGRDQGPVEHLKSQFQHVTPEAAPFLWCGAEKSQVRELRQLFREEKGIGPDRSYFSGYWLRPKADLS